METSGGESPASRRLIAMIEHDGQEPPAGFPERRAEASWAAASSLWHPALLARVDALPTTEGLEFPPVPEPGDVRLVAEGAGPRLPLDYRQVASDAGASVVEGGIDRAEIARRVLEILDPGADLGDPADPLVLDFLALGTARWWLRDLTIAMGHADCLDVESLAREALTGAKNWRDGDRTGAENRLRAAFEVLTQARERFYPVDSYLLDICLLDVGMPSGALADPLESRTPFSLLATASAIERAASLDPDRVAALRQAISDGWADVVGGTYAEVAEPLAPIASILWQFRKGGEVYRLHLDDRNAETLASRRFALYPGRPQVARRFGYRFALHLGLDAGRFPVPLESKRLWESADGSHLETLMRPPLAADRPSEGLRLPWRIAVTMKDDHVATVPMARWPSPVAGWFRDLRRVSAHSPVLSRSVTLGDFFHLSDRPWEMFRPKLDDYATPYLAQATARGAADPLSRRARHARLRARLDAMTALDALARALTTGDAKGAEDFAPRGPITASEGRFSAIEEPLETGRLDEAEAAISAEEPAAAGALAGAILGDGAAGPPGYLVLNPLGVPRRAAVLLPGASDDLRPEGPLLASQPTEDGVVAVVDLAAFGFAWVPKESSPDRPSPTLGVVAIEGRTLRNEAMEVEIDPATGGIRGVRARGERTARLGQQLAIAGLADAEGRPAPSRMVGDDFAIDYAGPALARASSRGSLLHPADGRTLARFHQEYRLWRGRPTLEIDVSLDDIDEDWLASRKTSDPWADYLSCRWAWADGAATLRRTGLLAPETTESERPETPDAIEIASRLQRTTLLFGGLAHHQRHGKRMLDTLLIAGGEAQRRFRLGVVLDMDHPFQAAADFLAHAPAVPTEGGPPRGGPSGWLVHVDSKAVAVVQVEFLARTGDGQGWGLSLVLAETAGRAARCRLRLFRDPVSARQTDFNGDLIIDLPTLGDAVPIDLTPNEMARVEVTLGP